MTVKNIKQLREDLLKRYNETDLNEEKAVGKLSSATACVSAIVRTAKVELEYKKFKEDKTPIDFLETD